MEYERKYHNMEEIGGQAFVTPARKYPLMD
jgi:hypothetical protein